MIYKMSYDNLVYIGSTSKTLEQRFKNHKNNYKIYNKYVPHLISYCSAFKLFENDNFDNVKIELIELLNEDCSKTDRFKREGEYIKQYKNDNNVICLNKQIQGRTMKEYKLDNKDILKEKDREYYKKNYDVISKKKKERIFCECGKNYTKSNRYKHVKVCSLLNNVEPVLISV
jgi:hypothetical protein